PLVATSTSFACSGHRLGLHSFPTRRSSDLSPPKPAVCLAVLRRGDPFGTAGDLAGDRRDQRGSAGIARVLHRRVPGARPGLAPRSEEHTSELQSRENLVCRLLLEQKNPESA